VIATGRRRKLRADRRARDPAGARRAPLVSLPAMPTLLVTNDFPPRAGGIQGYLAELAGRLPAGEIVVYALDGSEVGTSEPRVHCDSVGERSRADRV